MNPKKFLLGDTTCPCCRGYGVFPSAYSKFRIRLLFPNDVWEFMDEEFDTLNDAHQEITDLFFGDPDVDYDIVAPDGEIISPLPFLGMNSFEDFSRQF